MRTVHLPCSPGERECWYRSNRPLVVQPLAANSLVGQGYTAIRGGASQAPLPLISRRAKGRGEKTLAQSLQGQRLWGNALLAGQIVQGSLQIRPYGDYHSVSSCVLSGHETRDGGMVQASGFCGKTRKGCRNPFNT